MSVVAAMSSMESPQEIQEAISVALEEPVLLIKINHFVPGLVSAQIERRSGEKVIAKLSRLSSHAFFEIKHQLSSASVDDGLLNYTFLDRLSERDSGWVLALRPFVQTSLKRSLTPNALAPTETEAIAESVIRAVLHLHINNLIHGDIRPSNVLSQGVPNGWLLCDYLIPGTNAFEARHLTARDSVYIAPEIASDKAPTASSDVYSIGVLLRELAQNTRPAGPSRLRRDRFLRHLRGIADACVADEPTRRPSVDDVELALHNKGGDLLLRVQDKQRKEAVRHYVERNMIDVYGAARTLKRSQPLGDAIVKATALIEDHARNEVSFALWLQPEDNHHSTVLRLVLSVLQGYSVRDAVIRRQLNIDSRPLNVGRKIPPPELDAAWREEIFEDAQKLLQPVDPRPYEDVDSRISYVERYTFAPQEVLQRLESSLAAADEQRRLILSLDQITETDLLDLQLALPDGLSEEGSLRQATEAGLLLAVEDHGKLLFPAFQFSSSSVGIAPFPEIAQVNAVLGPQGRGWSRVLWWITPSPLLEDQRPADLLSTGDAAAVVEAAEQERRI